MATGAQGSCSGCLPSHMHGRPCGLVLMPYTMLGGSAGFLAARYPTPISLSLPIFPLLAAQTFSPTCMASSWAESIALCSAVISATESRGKFIALASCLKSAAVNYVTGCEKGGGARWSVSLNPEPHI